MDELKHCVIIYDRRLDKFIDKSRDIHTIKVDNVRRKYIIQFEKYGLGYEYNMSNVMWLRNPVKREIENVRVYYAGRWLSNINEVWDFGSWTKIVYKKGKIYSYPSSEIKYIKDCSKEKDVYSFIEYLKYVAELININSNNKIDEDDSADFFKRQLDNLSVLENSCLAKLLKKQNVTKKAIKGDVIYPFQANLSQMKAVDNALMYDFSVIQGPPGTGKTETILNILANLLVRDMSVAVVSGNNEATKNVLDKMAKHGLGEIGALLGKKENIEVFFKQKHNKAQLLTQFDISELDNISGYGSVKENVCKLYRAREEVALLCQKIYELEVEKKHHNDRYEQVKDVKIKSINRIRDVDTMLNMAAYLEALSEKETINWIDRLVFAVKYKIIKVSSIFDNMRAIIDILLHQYYKHEILSKKEQLKIKSEFIKLMDSKDVLQDFQLISMSKLKRYLKDKYSKLQDRDFKENNYLLQFNEFVQRYPIVYSTTHAIKSCSGKEFLYDYLIIDESSQVDWVSASIALSMAKNVVIVGDLQQISHIVESKNAKVLKGKYLEYNLPEYFDYVTHSLLSGILDLYGNSIPQVLLKEHYRCAREIIDFCNKRFYNEQLLIQTKECKESKIGIIYSLPNTSMTKKNKDTGKSEIYNEEQVYLIEKQILPKIELNDIGIIAPYRGQVKLLQKQFENTTYLIDTVHKFQGKECDVMIMSTVADCVKEYADETKWDFLNDSHLINVAISRAKKQFYLVLSQAMAIQEGTLLNDFIKYLRYYSPEVLSIEKSKTLSVFSIMRNKYCKYLEKERSRRKYDSDFEIIFAKALDEVFKHKGYERYAYDVHYSLSNMIDVAQLINPDDVKFVECENTHCDFVIYNKIDKEICFVVEIDGRQHNSELQKSRDERKDRLLLGVGINVYRLPTNAYIFADKRDTSNIAMEIMQKFCDDYLAAVNNRKTSNISFKSTPNT